jgi:hypothetical protein
MDNILQFKEIKSIGLALFGKCPKCDEKISIAELWKRTEWVNKSLVEWPKIKRNKLVKNI